MDEKTTKELMRIIIYRYEFFLRQNALMYFSRPKEYLKMQNDLKELKEKYLK